MQFAKKKLNNFFVISENFYSNIKKYLKKMEVYEIVKSIGSGSFGQVYLARHKREDKNYVIKKIKVKDMPQKDKENTEQEV